MNAPAVATDPGNLIAQALANTVTVEQALDTISGLPSGAQPVQTAAKNIIDEVTTVVRGVQTAAQSFVTTAIPLLANAWAALNGPDPAAAVPLIVQVQTAAGVLQPVVTGANTSLLADKADVDQLVQSLGAVDSDLTSQINVDRAQAQNDQQEVDSLNKTRLYWLALGPFGLVGLGVAIGELVTANNKVANIEVAISGLNAQCTQLATFKANIDQLSADLSELVTKVQDLTNAVGFLNGDLNALLADLQNTNTNLTSAKAFVITAQSELATVKTETA